MLQPSKAPESIQTYFYVRTLSEGRDSLTALYDDKATGIRRTIKIIPKTCFSDEEEISNYTQRISQYKTLRHPNLLSIENVFTDVNNVYIVTNYCAKGDLEEYIYNSGPFSETAGRNFFRQLISVVSFLQEKGISHRELNLENIYLESDFNIVFSGLDFNAKEQDSIILTRANLLFSAPEIVKGQSHSQIYTDMWSLGVVLYSIVCGRMPWFSSDATVLAGQINNSSLIFPLSFSPELTDLIKGLLDSNPILRFGLEDVLSHVWMRKPRRSSLQTHIVQRIVPACDATAQETSDLLKQNESQKSEKREQQMSPRPQQNKRTGRHRTTTFSFVKKMPPLL